MLLYYKSSWYSTQQHDVECDIAFKQRFYKIHVVDRNNQKQTVCLILSFIWFSNWMWTVSNAVQSSLLGPCGGDCVCRHTALCLYFDVLVSSGCFWVGRGCMSPSKWQHAGEVESTAEHSSCVPDRRKCSVLLAHLEQSKNWVWNNGHFTPSTNGIVLMYRKLCHKLLNFQNGGRTLQPRTFSQHWLGGCECRRVAQMQVIHVFALSTTMYTVVR